MAKGTQVAKETPTGPDPMTTWAGWDGGPSRSHEWTRRAAFVLLVVGLCGFLIDGVSRAQRPNLLRPGSRIQETGFRAFGTGLFTVTSPQAQTGPKCAVVARTPSQLAQGMQGQPTFGHFGAMLLVYPHPTAAVFSGKDLDLAVSVAWFDSKRAYIAGANVRPCRAGQECVSYTAGRPYLYALVAPAGRLGQLGAGAGSHLALGGPCSG